MEQSASCCKEGISQDCQALKRPLSVIQEHLDEESATPLVTASIHSNRHLQTEFNGRTDYSHTKSASTRKTRRKAISGEHPPDFSVLIQNGKVVVEEQTTGSHGSSMMTDSVKERISKDPISEGAMTRLKDTATKLNLKTRRQSYLTWRAEYIDKPRDPSEVEVMCRTDGKLTQERKQRIDRDLQWIKGQLIDLRLQDQSLARQLLGIRHELSNLRLAASCEEHKDLLDDAQDQMEELRELSRFADFPLEMLGSSPLRQIGVTKMNLSSRRFSTC